MDRLFDNPWFSRVWTIQEAAMAELSISFRLGNSTFTWDELTQFGLPEYTENPIPPGERYEGFNLRASLRGLRITAKEDGPEIAKLTVLSDIFKSCKLQGATEPRDRVFALYSLMSMVEIKMPDPDYLKPLEVVYMEAAKAIIEQDKTLNFLYLVNTDNQDPAFPSWALDFRNLSTRWEKLYKMDKSKFEGYYNPDTKTWSRGIGDNKPDNPEVSTPKFSLSLMSKTLTLYGRILGPVSSNPFKMPGHYSAEDLLKPSHKAEIDYIRTFRKIAVLIRHLDKYHTKESAHDVLRKILGCEPYKSHNGLFPLWCALIRAPASKINMYKHYRTFKDVYSIQTEACYHWRKERMWTFEDLFTEPQSSENRDIVNSPEFKILMTVLPDGQMGSFHMDTARGLRDNCIF